MRRSIGAGSEDANARQASRWSAYVNKPTFPAHIGGPYASGDDPGLLSRGSSLGVTYSPNVVGTANRADIRRLQQLEADNAPPATGERQQRQPHEGFVERDRTIRQLNELLSTRASHRSGRPSNHQRLYGES